ncbi:MAG: hypothetical protein PHY92_09390 [Alphaproteobacteria bacterium]|nr:hypothetical protein [Alphaproteobacteria bacterium]
MKLLFHLTPGEAILYPEAMQKRFDNLLNTHSALTGLLLVVVLRV